MQNIAGNSAPAVILQMHSVHMMQSATFRKSAFRDEFVVLCLWNDQSHGRICALYMLLPALIHDMLAVFLHASQSITYTVYLTISGRE